MLDSCFVFSLWLWCLMFVCLAQHTLRAEFVLESAPSMLLLLLFLLLLLLLLLIKSKREIDKIRPTDMTKFIYKTSFIFSHLSLGLATYILVDDALRKMSSKCVLWEHDERFTNTFLLFFLSSSLPAVHRSLFFLLKTRQNRKNITYINLWLKRV